MNDNVFLDTNIIVFGYSFTEAEKQSKARQLIAESDSFISTQVLQELANTRLPPPLSFNFCERAKAGGSTLTSHDLPSLVLCLR
jgi:hypothetical protein